MRERTVELSKRFAVHLAAHVLEPSTISYGLTDSPVGMLAWLLQRWTAWSDNNGRVEDVFARDELLTHATIYWAGNTIKTSIRTYANNNRYPWAPSHHRWPAVEAPTGITLTGYENPPGVTTTDQRVPNFLNSERAAWYNIDSVTAHDARRPLHPLRTPRRVDHRCSQNVPQPQALAGVHRIATAHTAGRELVGTSRSRPLAPKNSSCRRCRSRRGPRRACRRRV